MARERKSVLYDTSMGKVYKTPAHDPKKIFHIHEYRGKKQPGHYRKSDEPIGEIWQDDRGLPWRAKPIMDDGTDGKETKHKTPKEAVEAIIDANPRLRRKAAQRGDP